MKPWDIIGWGILFVLIGLPILGWLLQRIGRALLWMTQGDLRKRGPERYDRWVPLWGGPTYYVNGDRPIMVSTNANNLGGFYYSDSEWRETVRRHKLVRL